MVIGRRRPLKCLANYKLLIVYKIAFYFHSFVYCKYLTNCQLFTFFILSFLCVLYSQSPCVFYLSVPLSLRLTLVYYLTTSSAHKTDDGNV